MQCAIRRAFVLYMVLSTINYNLSQAVKKRSAIISQTVRVHIMEKIRECSSKRDVDRKKKKAASLSAE